MADSVIGNAMEGSAVGILTTVDDVIALLTRTVDDIDCEVITGWLMAEEACTGGRFVGNSEADDGIGD